ncbi:glycosyl hydrolase family 8 [Asaia krungthepensis]|uniref:glycosyl hydrolase family 8 n=1 Tax=Asaia krungthepensis TaxID=220990 RepID=UPI0022306023|nr:glycosyl hydrolase family 8 [Asaia krungthepensis]
MFRSIVRRQFCRNTLSVAGTLGLHGVALAQTQGLGDPDWELYKKRFMKPDGRIVDTGNHDVSHSEGQGYGLFFASTFNDRTAFDKILEWTRNNLKHRDGNLHSWRWSPNAPHVPDTNNASDGDLMIAWALRRGALLWRVEAYLDQAKAIIRDLGEKCVRKIGSRLVLLPGMKGFDRPKAAIVNLSYYLMPALGRAASLDPSGPWKTVMDHGQQLLLASRFGLWGLPPDWLAIDRKSERIYPAASFAPRFSYDAIRIPLYFKWGKVMPASLKQSLYAVSQNYSMTALPGWIDLMTGERSAYNAPPGFRAVYLLALNGADALPDLPGLAESDDYYSASLTLLARIASMELV